MFGEKRTFVWWKNNLKSLYGLAPTNLNSY